MKAQTAAAGFRVKSGWAAVVLLTGSIDSPVVVDTCEIHLSDPKFPETRQPYHADFGQLETDARKTNRRANVVRRVTTQSISDLLSEYRQRGYSMTRACLVVGSKVDPATIANLHIRAHSLEGQLFRSVLQRALETHGIHTVILLERDAYAATAARLKRSISEVRETVQDLGRTIQGSWRVEQKVAAAGAWLARC